MAVSIIDREKLLDGEKREMTEDQILLLQLLNRFLSYYYYNSWILM